MPEWWFYREPCRPHIMMMVGILEEILIRACSEPISEVSSSLTDLDDMLSRGQALQHLGADGLFGNGGDEILCHLIVDVRLQQGETNFPHGLFYISLGQFPFGAQLFKSR